MLMRLCCVLVTGYRTGVPAIKGVCSFYGGVSGEGFAV